MMPSVSDLRTVGHGVARPECVQALADGLVLCSNKNGGVSIVEGDGALSYRGDANQTGLVSNGFGIKSCGTVVFANVGPAGGIWSVDPAGHYAPVVEEVEGTPNFVLIGPNDEVWFSVLTAAGHDAPFSTTRADGYIARLRNGAVERMADGLVTANEFKIDASRGWLYVNETFAARTTRFDIAADGSLSNRQTVAEYQAGTFPDGLSLDANGDLWIPSIISNRILHVTKDGETQVLYEEYDPVRVFAVHESLLAGTLTRELIYQPTDATLENPSSLAFGGPDLKTLYVGSITSDYLCAFSTSVAGQPMPHWQAN